MAIMPLHQDADLFISEIEAGETVAFSQLPDRQLHLFCLAGSLSVNAASLESGDALKIREEGERSFQAVQDRHLVMVDVARI